MNNINTAAVWPKPYLTVSHYNVKLRELDRFRDCGYKIVPSVFLVWSPRRADGFCFQFEVSLKIQVFIHIRMTMHAWYRRSLVRGKITDKLGGWIGKLRLAELIVKLSELERNVYWCMEWRLKCLTGSYGSQGHNTSLLRR
jgi:hypothetical protein